MQPTDYLTLHVDDYKIVGYPLNAVALIEVDSDAVERREHALLLERIAGGKNRGGL